MALDVGAIQTGGLDVGAIESPAVVAPVVDILDVVAPRRRRKPRRFAVPDFLPPDLLLFEVLAPLPALRRPRKRRRALPTFLPPAPFVPEILEPLPVMHRRKKRRRPPRPRDFTGIEAEIITCTAGVWSTVVSFLPCDDFRVEIDGPATDEVKVSLTMELEE